MAGTSGNQTSLSLPRAPLAPLLGSRLHATYARWRRQATTPDARTEQRRPEGLWPSHRWSSATVPASRSRTRSTIINRQRGARVPQRVSGYE